MNRVIPEGPTNNEKPEICWSKKIGVDTICKHVYRYKTTQLAKQQMDYNSNGKKYCKIVANNNIQVSYIYENISYEVVIKKDPYTEYYCLMNEDAYVNSRCKRFHEMEINAAYELILEFSPKKQKNINKEVIVKDWKRFDVKTYYDDFLKNFYNEFWKEMNDTCNTTCKEYANDQTDANHVENIVDTLRMKNNVLSCNCRYWKYHPQSFISSNMWKLHQQSVKDHPECQPIKFSACPRNLYKGEQDVITRYNQMIVKMFKDYDALLLARKENQINTKTINIEEVDMEE